MLSSAFVSASFARPIISSGPANRPAGILNGCPSATSAWVINRERGCRGGPKQAESRISSEGGGACQNRTMIAEFASDSEPVSFSKQAPARLTGGDLEARICRQVDPLMQELRFFSDE